MPGMVENERSIFRNTGFSVIGRGIGDLATFLFLVVFARSFGSETLGEFSFAMAVGGILAGLVVPGFGTLLVREVARNPADGPRLVGAVAGLQLLIAACLFATLLGFGGSLIHSVRAWQILLILSAYHLLYTAGMPFRHYFRAREQTQFSAALEAGHKVIILLGGLVLITLIRRAEVVLLIYPLAAVCMYAGGYALLTQSHSAPRLHIDFDMSRRWSVASLPLFMTSILGVVEVRAGIIYLGSLDDTAAVGLFAAGDRLVAAAGLLFLMFNSALFPVMSRLSGSAVEANELLARCQRLAVTVALPVATTIVLLRQPIIELFFGRGFAAAADVLGILAIGMVGTAIAGPANILMLATHRLKAVLGIQLLSLTCYFVAMSLLIPRLGFLGLALSILILNLVSSLSVVVYLQRHGHAVPYWSMLRAPLAAAIGMVAVFELANALSLAVQIVLMVAAGALLLAAFGGVTRHDIAYLRRILGLAG